jgi:hypothetical protein
VALPAGRPVALPSGRDPSVYSSRRRYDSPEILRHLRSNVRSGWLARLWAGSGSDVKREYDRLGRAPRGWGRWGLRGTQRRRRWGRVERWQQQRQQQQRVRYGRRRHVWHGLVDAFVSGSPDRVVVVRRASALKRSVVAHAERRQQQHRHGDASQQRCQLTAKRGQHIVGPVRILGIERVRSVAPGGSGVQPSPRWPDGNGRGG